VLRDNVTASRGSKTASSFGGYRRTHGELIFAARTAARRFARLCAAMNPEQNTAIAFYLQQGPWTGEPMGGEVVRRDAHRASQHDTLIEIHPSGTT
jgi:hypothetical protein